MNIKILIQNLNQINEEFKSTVTASIKVDLIYFNVNGQDGEEDIIYIYQNPDYTFSWNGKFLVNEDESFVTINDAIRDAKSQYNRFVKNNEDYSDIKFGKINYNYNL